MSVNNENEVNLDPNAPVKPIPTVPVEPVVVPVNPTLFGITPDQATMGVKVASHLLGILDTVSQHQGWSQVSQIVVFVQGIVNDPKTLNLVLSLLGAASQLSQDQIKSLLNLASVSLVK